MLPSPKLPYPSAKLPPPTQIRWSSAAASPSVQRDCKVSRREISTSPLLLLVGSQTVTPLFPDLSKARADQISSDKDTSTSCRDKVPTEKAFLDISIDGEPTGKIVIGLYADEVPAGVARFVTLVTGAAGISYRRKEFVKIMPNYIQHGGIRSYGETGSFENLIGEWERSKEEKCTKNLAGKVGIVVIDPSRPPPKAKLVARNGKLEIDEEEVGVGPNGTEFVITTADSSELDESVLVVGEIVEGMNVVEKMRAVKTVKENTGSPYFRVAKLIGDKRAVVAERGFNRPYSKIIVSNCGLLE
ncbi:PREDICTED: peptidyl-prolyl cis-trans isomerase CYP26-2, chloroplastic [Tarenaya hassleriana]|uniref:peptidyl-prolyl cis-trans isomerase CYP26-2, chloroplastic n=1 Tax=Tarenaya hassleriana TaxID=28532 RepID=UPI00053C4AB6|nr:PREDICTED: peptidyl-prolyl cis-trans isomerase CYP26-2, chloroplastic [Tarenaya hassleriana]